MPGNTKSQARGSKAMNPASMRPQRNAGEYLQSDLIELYCEARFNEAPAKCRGIQTESQGNAFNQLLLQ